MGERRDLNLHKRKEDTREKKQTKVKDFDILAIKKHFDENVDSVKEHFRVANDLIKEGKIDSAKDIWRSQTVFIESALDFYIHEVTKYGMNKIYNKEWIKTEKFKNYSLNLDEIFHIISNPEDQSWFADHVNDFFSNKTFMNFSSIRDQLNLIGINVQDVADGAFYVQGSREKTKDKLEHNLDKVYKRRNCIAHQSDRQHHDGERINITESEVTGYIDVIEKIVEAIQKCVIEKGTQESGIITSDGA